MDWIAVDWGTSHLRAYAMAGTQIVDQATSAAGMGTLSRDGFEPALLALIDGWLGQKTRVPVIACGMVGARTGWQEAPYRGLPCAAVSAGALMTIVTDDPRIAVQIVPGLSQAAPADVMRGEETQIAGLLADHADQFDQVILPGTHSKHVMVAGQTVTGFTTYMTGELFALLSQQSVLRLSMVAEEGADAGPQGAAFAKGVELGATGALAHLFALRAEALLHDLTPAQARARLSGLLIGDELRHIRRATRPIAVIGSGDLAARYAQGLQLLGHRSHIFDGADLVIKGLAMARRKETV
nr:2-dehydro-3-deoxygalactonokinase [Thioclava sp. SK-1]